MKKSTIFTFLLIGVTWIFMVMVPFITALGDGSSKDVINVDTDVETIQLQPVATILSACNDSAYTDSYYHVEIAVTAGEENTATYPPRLVKVWQEGDTLKFNLTEEALQKMEDYSLSLEQLPDTTGDTYTHMIPIRITLSSPLSRVQFENQSNLEIFGMQISSLSCSDLYCVDLRKCRIDSLKIENTGSVGLEYSAVGHVQLCMSGGTVYDDGGSHIGTLVVNRGSLNGLSYDNYDHILLRPVDYSVQVKVENVTRDIDIK
ncbi:MAG: hypothetical protein IJ196_08085 [Prevotella sp.]|nr:hypothetical protein [Prevotella sp.]